MKMLAGNYQHMPFKKQIKIILATGIKPVNLLVTPLPRYLCPAFREAAHNPSKP